jgi:CelD/BcsL family acetyltransferase involved in cellulose biosynthesis
MDIQVTPAAQLTAEQIEIWSDLQKDDPALHNPFFRPEFTQAVASVRDGVRVALLKNSGGIVGFFPFQLEKRKRGRPVGWPMSDFQGIIAKRDSLQEAKDLILQTELKSWHFDHLVASQQAFQAYHMRLEPSPFLDLRDGFEAYKKARRLSGSSLISHVERKSRKMIKEQGPLRLVFDSSSAGVFSSLLRWKRLQLNKRNLPDIYQIPWIQSLLESALSFRNKTFAGRLTALYAGDALVSVHFGLQSGDNLSSWVPTINPAYERYSPGLLIHYELARAAAERGIKRIDLGRGLNQLKLRMMSGAVSVAVGAVELRPLHRRLKSLSLRSRKFVRTSPWYRIAMRLLRRVERLAPQ